MNEIRGNLWEVDAEAICITTNGVVKEDGCAVMGGGCALEAVQRYPGIERDLGRLLQMFGNHVHTLGYVEEPYLFSFPTKEHWREKSSLSLIERSATELTSRLLSFEGTCVIPRPGCGLGGLLWEDVKPVLEPLLDERFLVITP